MQIFGIAYHKIGNNFFINPLFFRGWKENMLIVDFLRY